MVVLVIRAGRRGGPWWETGTLKCDVLGYLTGRWALELRKKMSAAVCRVQPMKMKVIRDTVIYVSSLYEEDVRRKYSLCGSGVSLAVTCYLITLGVCQLAGSM